MNHEASSKTRSVACSLCGDFPDVIKAEQTESDRTEDNTYLPKVFSEFVPEDDALKGFLTPRSGIYRCPSCGTRYQLETSYEYFVGGGTEDEQVLTRLKDVD